MTDLPAECQRIADEIQVLLDQRAEIAADLQSASPQQKPSLASQIKKLSAEIAKARIELNKCIGAQPPPPPPVTCTLSGTMVFTTDDSRPVFRGPFSAPVTLTLTFSGLNHETVTLFFPPISLTVAFTKTWLFGITDNCTDTVTISLPAGAAVGRYRSSFPFDVNIPLTFHVGHSITGGVLCRGIPTASSTLPLTSPDLTTGSVSSPISGTLTGAALNKTAASPNIGSITLVGVGVLTGGLLNGHVCDIVLPGTLSQPLP